jgi:hypothetical protein
MSKTPLPALSRFPCGRITSTPRARLVTLTVAVLFVIVMVLAGQPLTVAAGVVGWLITVIAAPTAASGSPMPHGKTEN